MVHLRSVPTGRLAISLSLGLALVACQQPSAPPSAASDSTTSRSDVAPAPTAPPRRAPGLAPKELGQDALMLPRAASDLCYPGRLDGSKLTPRPTRVRQRQSARIDGWVGDPATGSRAEDPHLRILEVSGPRAWDVPVGAPTRRTDVARHTGKDSLLMSGFNVVLDLRELPAGDYRLQLVYEGANGPMVCDQNRVIRLGAK